MFWLFLPPPCVLLQTDRNRDPATQHKHRWEEVSSATLRFVSELKRRLNDGPGRLLLKEGGGTERDGQNPPLWLT